MEKSESLDKEIAASALSRFGEGGTDEANNPLTVLLLTLNHLEQMVQHAQINLDALAQVSRRAHQAAHQISFTMQQLNILSDGKLNQGVSKELDLNQLISESLGERVFVALSSGVNVSSHFSENTPFVHANPFLLKKSLVNMIQNALDSMSNCSSKQLEISTAVRGDVIEIKIADSGCGIAPQHYRKIYDPFFSTKPLGNGGGLGLSFASAYILSLGGGIAFKSSDQGTTFTVTLNRLTPKH